MSKATEALKIVVVGGVAGGASAAARARRVNASAEITLLEKGPHISFANCGLPYHIGGEIEDRARLLVATQQLFWDRFRIRVQTGHEVQHIDRAAQTVSGRTTAGQAFDLPYDRLILATGSTPVVPDFCQEPAENLFQLWTLDDMDRIIAYMKQHPCKQAVVVGAGFVGLEVVEQLARQDIRVTLLERLKQVLGPLDPEMARMIEHELRAHDVDVRVGVSVESLLTDNNKVTAVKLADATSVPTDLVIVGVGVRPRIELAEQAGLKIGSHGGVTVNDYCQTSDPLIYAVGDMIETYHGTLGKYQRIPLAGPANRAGRIAGTHAASGRSPKLPHVQGTSILRVFDLAAGCTGVNDRVCRSAGIDFCSVIVQAPHHASYFPGARNLTLKLTYHATTGQVLGLQAVGAGGVDKRLDVAATVLQFEGTVDDLAGLDLAYAPPFGSAKDPLHMAAFAAQNDLENYPDLLAADVDLSQLQVVDVRTAKELEQLPLPGAVHIPIDELADRWEELDHSRPTVAVCHSGKRAHVAACWLKGQGFQSVANLSGGVSIRKLHD